MSQLKDIYTPDFFIDLTTQIEQDQPNFKTINFTRDIFNQEWENFSLRQRMKRIAYLLGIYLEGDYDEQLAFILTLHEKKQGFNYLFLPDFVGIYGLDEANFDLSLRYLESLTTYSSAEFAIREFIKKDRQRVQPYLLEWSKDDNEHVRRLASEGSRPRLPWGVQLTDYIEQPELNLQILTNLKNDPSLYVRKSVANHLNDVSKDHPDFVIDICQSWLGETPKTDWIIRKSCRTMIKKAYPQALDLFGYETPGTSFDIVHSTINLNKESIVIGESMTFNYLIETTISQETPIRLEYGIDYIKFNGKPSLKKFHLSDGFVTKQNLSGKKKVSFKNLSTRKHYAGVHRLILFCNGQEIAETQFLVIN